MKGLINLKNKDHKCFMWCHVRLINPQNRKAERINKQDKKIAANLSYSDIVFPVDIKIYADTECFLKRTNSYEGEHLIKYQEHRPNSIGAKLICIDDRFTLPSIIFKVKDCINKFITWVLDKEKWTNQITKKYFNKRLIMTNKDEEIYNNSYICLICKQELNTDKVRDYCHVTGKFRGAAHIECNLKN